MVGRGGPAFETLKGGGAGGQQEQRQKQPVALVGPGLQLGWLAVAAQAFGAIEQAEAAQVALIQGDLLEASADLAQKGTQAGAVQARDKDCALPVLEEGTVLLNDRRALGAADAEHVQARVAGVEGLADALAFLLVQAAADQQMAWVWYLLTAASAGVFLHAGIKFPWFVFFQKDSGLRPADPLESRWRSSNPSRCPVTG